MNLETQRGDEPGVVGVEGERADRGARVPREDAGLAVDLGQVQLDPGQRRLGEHPEDPPADMVGAVQRAQRGGDHTAAVRPRRDVRGQHGEDAVEVAVRARRGTSPRCAAARPGRG
ncbi:hypothetical protein ACU686_23410 [Yinghuangia aomiensis]